LAFQRSSKRDAFPVTDHVLYWQLTHAYKTYQRGKRTLYGAIEEVDSGLGGWRSSV
jgi:hypothetical protein